MQDIALPWFLISVDKGMLSDQVQAAIMVLMLQPDGFYGKWIIRQYMK